MTQSITTLSKRTKPEIIAEFEKLQEQMERLRSTAQNVYSQPAKDLIEKTRTKTPQTIDTLIGDFQTSLHTHLMDLRASLLEQSTTLQDLQKAIELSRQQLELQHHISVASDTLDVLVDDHAKRVLTFETDMEKRKRELDEQITTRKKSWEREAEEYEYQKKLKYERDQIDASERQEAVVAREAAIHSQEQEIQQMKKTIEQFPKELEQVIQKNEQEIVTQFTQKFAHEKALLENETSTKIRLLELTVKNLEERFASQEQQMVSLKQQAEEANAKAQILAMKAIERPTTIVAPTNATPPTP